MGVGGRDCSRSLAPGPWPLRAPTACRHTVSGSISLPSSGFFSPFPHGTVRYRSPGVFSLRRWSPQLPTGFRVSRGTQERRPESLSPSPTGLSPSVAALSRALRLRIWFVTLRGGIEASSNVALLPRLRIGPHTTKRNRFRLLPFRSPLLGEYSLFLGVLRCFSSPTGPPFYRGDGALPPPGCPIRESPGESWLGS